VRALLIPALGPVQEVEPHCLRDLQRLLGGPVEALPIPDREDAAAYVNEEGLLDQLPDNPRATGLLGLGIAGPALLCGFDLATGEQTAIRDDLATQIRHALTAGHP
jgi:hypothetical protein